MLPCIVSHTFGKQEMQARRAEHAPEQILLVKLAEPVRNGNKLLSGNRIASVSKCVYHIAEPPKDLMHRELYRAFLAQSRASLGGQ